MNSPLMSIGLDSIAGVELVQTLSSTSGLQISPTMLFDHPTLESITSFIRAEAGGVYTQAISVAPESRDCQPEVSVPVAPDCRRRVVAGMLAWSFQLAGSLSSDSGLRCL